MQLVSPLRELMPYGIMLCYLPPGKGCISTFTPANYSQYLIQWLRLCLQMN